MGNRMEAGELPIHAIAEELVSGIRESGRVVLRAPTGSGKSTQVPQILLDRAGVEGAIVVLQPRRLAARMLAARVAAERGVKLGEAVGYQIRFENRTSAATRIRFVTEAILLRQVLADPGLPGVGAVVLAAAGAPACASRRAATASRRATRDSMFTAMATTFLRVVM